MVVFMAAAELDLRGKSDLFATFNVPNLTRLMQVRDSRANPFQEGEDDTISADSSAEGPIIRL